MKLFVRALIAAMMDRADKDERRRLLFKRTPTDLHTLSSSESIDDADDKQPKGAAQSPHQAVASSSDGSQSKSASSSADSVHNVPPETKKDEEPPAPFKALFNFTTRRNLKIMIPGIALSILDGIIRPMLSVILGLLFDVIAAFQSGESF